MSRKLARTCLAALVPLLAACSSPPPPPPADLGKQELVLAALLDVLWEWQGTETPNGTTAVEDPSLYTLRFEAGVRAALRADCNRGFAKYTVTGEALRVDPRAVTRAACSPESIDYIFLREIEDAATYEIVGGELRIRLRSTQATMKFLAAPPAP